jgi:CMP-2-keto-3-deoxyoctulosonic acid synthetase
MTPLEKIEGIELLRALENDLKLGTFITKTKSFSVDIMKDYLKAIKIISKDSIRKKY